MRPRCAGTRSRERRCPAKGLWTLRRLDPEPTQEHVRVLVLFCSALSRCHFSPPRPPRPAPPASCFSFRTASCPVPAVADPRLSPRGRRAWHRVPQFRHQAGWWQGPLLAALWVGVVTSVNPEVGEERAGPCSGLSGEHLVTWSASKRRHQPRTEGGGGSGLGGLPARAARGWVSLSWGRLWEGVCTALMDTVGGGCSAL